MHHMSFFETSRLRWNVLGRFRSKHATEGMWLSSAVSKPFLRLFAVSVAIWSLIWLTVISARFITNESVITPSQPHNSTEDKCTIPPWDEALVEKFALRDVVAGQTFDFLGGSMTCQREKLRINVHNKWQNITDDVYNSLRDVTAKKPHFAYLRCDEPGKNDVYFVRPPQLDDFPPADMQSKRVTSKGDIEINDVVLILWDAVSRAHFHQDFPETLSLFESINAGRTAGGQYKVIDFSRHHVVGQNSPPNKRAIYGGLKDPALPVENATSTQFGRNWVWEMAHDNGYLTMHSDGECGGPKKNDYADGAVLKQYLINRGFDVKIPKYFPHSSLCIGKNWDLQSGAKHYVDLKVRSGCKDLADEGRTHERWCIADRPTNQVTLDYLTDFLAQTRESERPRWASVTNLETHQPSVRQHHLDRRFSHSLREILSTGILKPNSTIFIVSDHGLHYGEEYSSPAGFLHHKLPLLHVILPTAVAEKAQLPLKVNHITSHFDTYQTIKHILTGTNVDESPVAKALPATKYGKSLLTMFPEPVPRECADAGVSGNYCACGTGSSCSADPMKAVDALFKRLNTEMEKDGWFTNNICPRFNSTQSIPADADKTKGALLPDGVYFSSNMCASHSGVLYQFSNLRFANFPYATLQVTARGDSVTYSQVNRYGLYMDACLERLRAAGVKEDVLKKNRYPCYCMAEVPELADE
ncbi:hypothetical protein HDU85_000957 [Gaertneriomyces sp. JEL0708]|nr:hypothetical protein HDU85_000957 [Gaertneriomyces sp. JEL0708]